VLHGTPVQWREVQNHESRRFLSYFPRFLCLQGGISTGFHHVSHSPPENIKKLYRIRQGTTGGLVVHEVPATQASLVGGDVYVLDKGVDILQLNTKKSVGKERFKAAEFVQSIVANRHGPTEITVYGQEIMFSILLIPIEKKSHDIQTRVTPGHSNSSTNSVRTSNFAKMTLHPWTLQESTHSSIAYQMQQEI